jgi:GNAT superfamily N-acetyltransferase
VIRPARRGDGVGLARIWLENARYYVERFPSDFRVPDEDGLAEFFDVPMADDDAIALVAEVNGEVAAFAYARVSRPDDHARFQYLAPYVETRGYIEALGTGDAYQRRGLATLLVEACEAWAFERGATQMGTATYLASELSIPFWEQRMGYSRRGVNLVKRLEEA